MKKFFILNYLLSVLLLSCNSNVEPEKIINPHGIYFSDEGVVYKMDYDGANKMQLTFNNKNNVNPFLSIDGKYLIYETQSTESISHIDTKKYSAISIMDLSCSILWEIVDETEWCTEPSISLNNQLIVFCSHQYDLYRTITLTDINGKEFKKLTEYGPNRNPVFTPNGDKIIYDSDIVPQTNLFSIDLTGKNKQQLTDTEFNINPVFSADGNKILWVGFWDLFLMNIDGTNKINLTNDNLIERTVSYSYDGQKIVYTAEKTGGVHDNNPQIYIMDLNTKEKLNILATGFNFSAKFLPGDNKIIFYQSIDSEYYICTINTDGSNYKILCKGETPFVY